MKKMTKNKIGASLIVLALITAIVGIVCFLVGNETKTKTHTDSTVISSYIDCNATHPADPFLSSDLSNDSNYEIKATFDEDGINTFSYTYTGNFASSKIADSESSRMLSKYNTYMGRETSFKNNVLSPTFSPISEKLIINLFIPKKYLDKSTAKLVFLSDSEYSEIANLNDYKVILEKLKIFYQEKGFQCEVKE